MPTTTTSPKNSPTHRRTSTSYHTDLKLVLPATTDPPSATNPPSPKVWLVFGATGHMGRSIVKAALSHNDSVCAVGQLYADALPHASTFTSSQQSPPQSRFLAQLCDVRIRSTVQNVLTTTLSHFTRIDIIAICSGYGVIGSCEDQDEFLIRSQFETNFMGTLNILQLSLPYFRTQQGGRYLVFSSTSGALGVPGLGPYCATKYAVEGLIESMLYEVDGFGVKCTLVEPGHLRRDDIPNTSTSGATPTSSPSSFHKNTTNPTTAQSSQTPNLPLYAHFRILKPSAPYSSPDSPSKHAQRLLQWIGNHQPTSGAKAAELVWQLGHARYPPLRLLLGTYAVESVRDRLKSVIEEIEDWKYLNFPRDDSEDEVAGSDEGEGEGEDEEESSGGGSDDDGESERVDAGRGAGGRKEEVKREEDVEMGGNGDGNG
jgi:NAD(P)-dependent dehydrogenase (short-subunit alcohol dehydrogenase family)